MAYRVRGLCPAPFQQFFGQSDAALARKGVIRCPVESYPGTPDRVTMQDLAVGETALLLNFEHLPVDSPYRSRHAIYVKEGATEAYDAVDTLPEVMTRRILSLRGIDRHGHIADADLSEGDQIATTIKRLLQNPEVAYIHAHYAQRGCFAGLIERA
ncbi:MAG: DUF1203 domain-containing protein [Pseudomonadota bacterium]